MTNEGSMLPAGMQRRRTPRLKTQLRVQVMGVDTEPRVTAGDISLGGLYIDTDQEIGPLGSVQRLCLASVSSALQITLLARVVRVATVNDFWRGQVVAGVAFQFMFEELSVAGPTETIPIEQSAGVRDFVSYLIQEESEKGARLDHVWQGTLDSSLGRERATVNGVSLQGTVLETDFPVPVGEMIRVEIPGPDHEQRIPLFGRAIETRPLFEGANRFRTIVSFETQAEPSEPVHGSIQAALGALLTAAPGAAAVQTERQHLAGDLARISLPTVLMVCELERATGVLQLRAAGQCVSCYVLSGRLIDVEAGDSQTPQAALAAALDWSGGSFEFLFQPVDRADRIGMPASALVLTLLQARDEKRR